MRYALVEYAERNRVSAAQIKVFPSVPALQEAAADFVAGVLRLATPNNPIRIALSGGSTPRGMHALLAQMVGIDWRNVHIFFGDERTVGPDDPQSNYRMAQDTLLAHVPIPAANIHRMRGEDEPAKAAATYSGELRESFGLHSTGLPVFDLIILGMGADGHTASLFPGTAALEAHAMLVAANEVPQLNTWRITLTYPVLNAARRVLFLVTGADKAEAVSHVFDPTHDDRPPAAFVQPSAGDLLWYVDATAAAGLPEGVKHDNDTPR